MCSSDLIREQFKNKLAERLKNPRVISAQLYGLKDCYKIKLRASGYRLIYEVNDKEIYVMVIAIAKRDKSYVYALAEKRAKRID